MSVNFGNFSEKSNPCDIQSQQFVPKSKESDEKTTKSVSGVPPSSVQTSSSAIEAATRAFEDQSKDIKSSMSTRSAPSNTNAEVIPQISLAAALLPESVLESCQRIVESYKDLKKKKLPIGSLATTAALIFKTVLEMATAYEEGHLSKMDPSVCDHACERRAYFIHSIASSGTINAEVASLKKLAAEILQNKSPVSSFQQMQNIKISEKMAYLLQTYFLTKAKTVHRDMSGKVIYSSYSGAEIEKNDPSELAKLLKGSHNTSPKDIPFSSVVEFVKEQLVKTSIKHIEMEASKITTLPKEKHEALKKILVPVPNPSPGSKFYYRALPTFQAIISRLQEVQAYVLIKQLIPLKEKEEKSDKERASNQPITLLYHSATPGGPFERITTDMNPAQLQSPVFVLDAAIAPRCNADTLAGEIERVGGLFEMILGNIAVIDDEESYKNASYEDLSAYREKAKKMEFHVISTDPLRVENPFLLLDHAYCSSLKHELPKKDGK